MQCTPSQNPAHGSVTIKYLLPSPPTMNCDCSSESQMDEFDANAASAVSHETSEVVTTAPTSQQLPPSTYSAYCVSSRRVVRRPQHGTLVVSVRILVKDTTVVWFS